MTCEVCGKVFSTEHALLCHLNIQKDNEHYLRLLEFYQEQINSLSDNVKVISVENINNRKYLKVFNPNCNHTSIIRYDRILNGCLCNNSTCNNLKRRKALLKYNENRPELHNEHIRNAYKNKDLLTKISVNVKKSLSTRDIKERHLQGIYNSRLQHAQGIAKSQRKRKSKDELYAINLFNTHNIKYKWQVPFITDSLEAIIDFYLPDFDIYININTDSFHHKPDLTDSELYKKRANYTLNKDELLINTFSCLNKKLIMIYDLNQITELIQTLERR